MSTDVEDRVLELVVEVEDLLETDAEAALARASDSPADLTTHPEVRLCLARATALARGPEHARALLEALVADEPKFSEARHALALVYEELGDAPRAVEQFLAVRNLDAAQDAEDDLDLASIENRIVTCAEQVLGELPSPFRERLKDIPVLVEDRPSVALVREGFDPRSLGLFEGPDHAERGLGDASGNPTRIVLYSANLAAFVDPGDEEELAREVEITLLHEIGHYFGLDEDQVDALGLG